MPVKMTPEQLRAKLVELPAKDLLNNLLWIEQKSLKLATEMANLEVVAEIYREVAAERSIQIHCHEC